MVQSHTDEKVDRQGSGQMKKLIAIAAIVAATVANADVVDDAIKGTADHVVAPVANEISKRMMRAMAQGKGPMAEAARANLKQQDLAEKEANRGVRRSAKECMKPGNVIDDDVQECVRGYREKTWQTLSNRHRHS